MKKKHTILKVIALIIKIIIKLAILAGLIWAIYHLLFSENGLIAKSGRNAAQTKLDEALKRFSADSELTLEDALNQIDGIDELNINEESGMYTMKIDGYEFMVMKQEMKPEDEKQEEKKPEDILKPGAVMDLDGEDAEGENLEEEPTKKNENVEPKNAEESH